MKNNLKKTKRTIPYNRIALIVVVLLCAVGGLITLVYSRADTVSTGSFEAETMTINPTLSTTTSKVSQVEEAESFSKGRDSAVQASKTASGGSILAMNRVNTVTKTITTTVPVTSLQVIAYSTACGGFGQVDVSIDGSPAMAQMTTNALMTYNAPLNLAAGSHAIAITFPKDGYAKNVCDRNLYVDSVVLLGQKTVQTSKIPAYVVADATVKSGNILQFNSNGTASITVVTPAVTTVTVTAKNVTCNGDASLKLSVDDTRVLDTTVSSTVFTPYKTALSLAAGSHTLVLAFDNDAYQKNVCDRNLLVDSVEFTPVAVATPAPVSDPLTTNPYSADSVWYNPLPNVTALDPNSANIVANIKQQSVSYFNSFGFNNASYAPPFFIAEAHTPTVAVGFWDCQKKGYTPGEFVAQMKAVPIPANAVPASGTDSEMVIYQPSTQTMYEMWKTRRTASGGWEACWGGRMTDMSNNRGVFNGSYGTTATSLPFLGSTIMINELKASQINHAVAFAVVNARSSVYSWPAHRTDGNKSDINLPMEGQRFRLDPNLNIDALNMTPAGKTIAKAIQKYGMILRDRSGNVTVYGESSAPYIASTGTNPYGSILNGTPTYNVLKGFPWGSLQALPKDYGK